MCYRAQDLPNAAIDGIWVTKTRRKTRIRTRTQIFDVLFELCRPRKSTRAAMAASGMSFEDAKPFLTEMKQDELVAAIGRVWDASPALRGALDAATAEIWSRAPDQSKMLTYNWEEHPKPRYYPSPRILFKDANACENPRARTVTIGNVWCHLMGMYAVNGLLEGGELVWEDEDGEEGCGECEAPGSKCTVTLEMNREGALRLVADSEITCYCNSGEAHVAATEHAKFRIAREEEPKRKNKRKAK